MPRFLSALWNAVVTVAAFVVIVVALYDLTDRPPAPAPTVRVVVVPAPTPAETGELDCWDDASCAVPGHTCYEDEPCWDCETMGNGVCGPDDAPAAAVAAQPAPVAA